MARPGDIVAGRFELEAEVAAGPQGTVYRARDRARNLLVALKVGTSSDARRTAREAAALGALSHPNIVRLEAHGTLENGARFVAMEWLEGSTLAAHLETAGTLSVAETLQLGSALGAALAHVHARGFVHRDVKPANVLITTDHRVHLVDFGVAVRRSETLRLTLPGGLVGTPAYMAPDLARAEGELDGRADVYSLGCVLYECLTGAPPFHGEHAFAVLAKVIVDEVAPIGSKRDDVPGPVAAWIERMLRKSRSERPDAETVVAALHALAERGSARGDTVRPTADAAPAERRVLSVVLTAPVDAGGATLTAIEADRSVARTTELARARGGVVDQLATGSFVAVFGGRGASSDYANRAAGYALDLVALGETKRAAVVTARAEDERRASESLIDRAMELLLDARDPNPGVLADGSTSALLDGRFVVTPRWADGARLTRRPAGDSEPRRLLGKTTPFVGREAELNELLDVVATCCASRRARSALLVAEAGMGKSRLAVEVVAESLVPRDARTRGLRWLHGRGESAGAFSLMGNLVRSAIGASIGDALDIARKKLDARLGVGPHAEFLGEIAQVPTARESDALAAARTDPALMGDAVRAALLAWISAELRDGPLGILLEDLHWADAPSLALVEALLTANADRPLFVLGTSRPEFLSRSPAISSAAGARVIRLGPLTELAASTFVRSILDTGSNTSQFDDSVARALVGRAGGHPFFLEELIRAFADGRTEQQFADTALGMLEARLDALPLEARRTARIASVFGATFCEAGLEAVDAIDRAPARRSAPEGGPSSRASLDGSAGTSAPRTHAELTPLEILVERELIEPIGAAAPHASYRFRHALVRDAAYAGLTTADRALYHRRAGLFLEAEGVLDPVAIADHFDKGGDVEAARGHYQRAAELALEGNDLPRAVNYVERAMAGLGAGATIGALKLLSAEVRFWKGDLNESEDAARQAIGSLERGSINWYNAAAIALGCAGQRGDNEGVARWLEIVFGARAQPSARSAELVCTSRGLSQLLWAHERTRIAALLDRHAALASSGGVVSAIAQGWATRVQGERAMFEGRLDASFDLFQQAVGAYERGGALRLAAFLQLTRGAIAGAAARPELARTDIAVGNEAALRIGAPLLAGYARLVTGIEATFADRFEEGAAHLTSAMKPLAGNARMSFVARFFAALASEALDELDAAIEHARGAASLPVVAPLQTAARGLLAHLHVARGHIADARSIGAPLARWARGGPPEFDLFAGYAEYGLAEVLLLDADVDGARAALARASDFLEKIASHMPAEHARRYLDRRFPNRELRALAARLGE